MKHQWEFRPLNREERAEVYVAHMACDFPDDELKPLPLLEQLIAVGINSFWGCFRDGALVGYYVLAHIQGSPLLLLDYLAVVPELRDTGCGTVILRQLQERLPAGQWLCIESERPESASEEEERRIRIRRVAFYRRGGAVRTPVHALLFGVDYALLVLTREALPTAEEVERWYQQLYQEMLGDRYRERVPELVRTLREDESLARLLPLEMM